MNYVTDDVLLAKSGYKYSPYISFKNPHLKKVHESLEKAFLSGNSLPDMITNGFWGLLNYPLDLLKEYFKHLEDQRTERQKALKAERANWDNEQLKRQNLTKNDVFLLLAKTALTAHATVPNLLQNKYPVFYNALPKDKNDYILYSQLNMKQKHFIRKVSEKVIMNSFYDTLNKTFGRRLTNSEIQHYKNVITKMGYHSQKIARNNPFMQTKAFEHQR